MQELPLKGVKVLELATVVAAPTVARMMADYGADVIKIEAPNGDLLRSIGGGFLMPMEPDNNPLYDLCNSGKKMVSLDLKKPEGMAIFHRILAESDVFVTNVRMRSLEKMGLGYEALKEKYPRLVYAHFSGFGLTGPDVDRPGFDSTAFWLRSGPSQDWLTPGAFPLRPAFAFGDLATASSFLSGIMMALYARNNTGHGTLVSTSLYHSGIWCSACSMLDSQYGREYPVSRYQPWNPFSDLYECADGEWLALMQKEYGRDKPVMAWILDLPELLEDPRYADLTTMRESGVLPVLSKKMEALMYTRPCHEWEELFNANDIPNERLRHYREIPKDEQAAANGVFDYVNYKDGKYTAFATPPINFSDYGKLHTTQAGDVGADTDAVLKAMGLSDTEIAALREKGIVK